MTRADHRAVRLLRHHVSSGEVHATHLRDRGELLALRWEDIDLTELEIRLPDTGQPHRIPLPRPAAELLEALERQGGQVFPGTGASGHLEEPRKAWARVLKRAGVSDVRLHDLRRTLGSWMAAAGYSLPIIGRALNHKHPQVTAIYARTDNDTLRAAFEATAARMLETTNGKATRSEASRGYPRSDHQHSREVAEPAHRAAVLPHRHRKAARGALPRK